MHWCDGLAPLLPVALILAKVHHPVEVGELVGTSAASAAQPPPALVVDLDRPEVVSGVADGAVEQVVGSVGVLGPVVVVVVAGPEYQFNKGKNQLEISLEIKK